MRPFIKQSLTIVALVLPLLGLLLLGAAFLSGAPVAPPSAWRFVAMQSELPDDGTPLLKTVYEGRHDAWLQLPDRPLGNVFVRKEPGTAHPFAVAAWHRGKLQIPIEFDLEKQCYQSVCWNVAFDLHGRQLLQPGHVRDESDLAVLPVQIRQNAVWVNLDSHDSPAN
jgi:hypothetical protein